MSSSWLGETLGPYRILREIGAGSMGVVYEAAHSRLAGKRYAIKMMTPALVGPELLARFRREAEILARLSHPGIVAVHDFDRAVDGSFYLVMDRLEGEDLAARLARSVIDAGAVARIVAQVVDGLDAAHGAGVIHRDLKPANIFLCRPDDRVVILDFGVAIDTRDPTVLTGTGQLVGTPAYMSPEQAAGQDDLDRRTDVFALGAIVWEMLTGVPAFGGPTASAVFEAIRRGPRPDLRRFRPDLDPAIAAVLDRALAIDRTRRPASVRELGSELVAALGAKVSLAPQVRADEPAARDRDLHLDDDVQFTVYRPRVASPEIWHPLLAFAHLAERPIDAAPGEPDPIEEVKKQAAAILGERAAGYQEMTQDSRQAVPREGELTFVPEVAGVTFNPRSRSFLWLEPVHREEFRFKAPARLVGTTARGRVTVYLGRIILAEIPLALKIAAGERFADTMPSASSAARPYRKIFASYSHADIAVVEELERYANTLGDVYLRDWVHLRSGEVWSDRLEQLIAEADVFQLFWSTNSMRSPFVRQEWEHALSLGRPSFVRPTYWEEPMPMDPGAQLPPPELARLHFQKIGWAAPPAVTRVCPGCGHQVGAGYDFCGECGAGMTAPPDSRQCARCGKENEPHYQFCLGCGAHLRTGAVSAGPPMMMKTMMADTSDPGPGALPVMGGPPPGGSRPGGLPMGAPAPGGPALEAPAGARPPTMPGAPMAPAPSRGSTAHVFVAVAIALVAVGLALYLLLS